MLPHRALATGRWRRRPALLRDARLSLPCRAALSSRTVHPVLRTSPCVLLIAVLAMLAPAPARAEAPALPEAIRTRLERGTASGAWQSVAVGLLRQGETATFFFGHRDGSDGAALDADSRIQLGPLTSAYVGLLLADAALDGKVRLEATLRETLPASRSIADPGLASLRLSQLAGVAGLPAVPANLFPGDEADPLRDYTAAALDDWLARARPTGRAQQGGHLGAGVLAAALGEALSGSWETRLRERVLQPLELRATDFDDKDLVSGHALGERVAPWHYGVLAGLGGLRSTLADQLRFAQALLRPGEGPLRAALLLARQPRDGAALGWQTANVHDGEQDWPLLWQGGSAGGHASFLGFRTDRQEAVVLLGNAEGDLTALGLALLADTAPAPAPLRLRRAAAEASSQVAGLYRFGPDDELVLRPRSEGLFVQVPGQFAQPLWPWEEDAYALPGGAAQITFQRNAAGRVESLVLHAGGTNRAAARLSQAAPVVNRVTVEIEAASAEACAGDYALNEDVWMRLSRRSNGLQWQVTGTAPRPLQAFAADRYASGDGEFELACERDGAGRVAAVVLDLAGRTRRALRLESPADPRGSEAVAPKASTRTAAPRR